MTADSGYGGEWSFLREDGQTGPTEEGQGSLADLNKVLLIALVSVRDPIRGNTFCATMR